MFKVNPGAVTQRCSIKKGVLRNLENSQETTARVSFLIRRVTLLTKKLRDRCFPVDFAKFLRTLFLKEHCFSNVLENLFNVLNIWN